MLPRWCFITNCQRELHQRPPRSLPENTAVLPNSCRETPSPPVPAVVQGACPLLMPWATPRCEFVFSVILGEAFTSVCSITSALPAADCSWEPGMQASHSSKKKHEIHEKKRAQPSSQIRTSSSFFCFVYIFFHFISADSSFLKLTVLFVSPVWIWLENSSATRL